MNSAYMTVFTVLAVLLTVVDFNYCRQAYLKTGKIAQYLGLSSFAAGAVTASYLVSLLAGSYTVMSVASSIYFASIDWMLVSPDASQLGGQADPAGHLRLRAV